MVLQADERKPPVIEHAGGLFCFGEAGHIGPVGSPEEVLGMPVDLVRDRVTWRPVLAAASKPTRRTSRSQRQANTSCQGSGRDGRRRGSAVPSGPRPAQSHKALSQRVPRNDSTGV